MGISNFPKEQFFSAFLLMFTCITAGYFLRRKKVVTDEGKHALTAIIWKLTLPCMAFTTFIRDFSVDDLRAGGTSLVSSLLFYLLFIGIGFFLFSPLGKDKATIAGLMCGIGQLTLFTMPLVRALGLETATLYCGMMTLTFRFILYLLAAPLIVCSGEKWGNRIKTMLLNPVMIAMFMGFLIWICQGFAPFIRIDRTLPPVFSVMNTLADLVCPLSMLLVGMILGESEISSVWKDKAAWASAAIRTVICPICVFAIAKCLPVLFDHDAVLALTLGFAAPASVTLCAFCAVSGKEETLASRIVALTTLICIITIPCFLLLTYI